jgi:predicted aldo/keto reductase-like oxidoreductase
MQYRKFGKTGDEVSILGYGCMRFPRINGKIDEERTEKQILSAIEKGVNYFDTAYLYPGSEAMLGKVLEKTDRKKVKIATKVPTYMVHSKKDLENALKTQLERLRTDYIDYYLVHALQDYVAWQKAKEWGMLEFLEEMKKSGVIKNIGFSYHGDKNDFKKLIDDDVWDFCQIQYNYIDENNQAGREGLDYAYSKGIGVVVMEPLRGGSLVGKMPKEIKSIWNKADVKRSYADWAMRWLFDQPEVAVVLSGMNEEEHIEENIKIASETHENSLTQKEMELYKEVKDTFLKIMKIGCTGCGYCLPCPKGVNIPFCFSYYNSSHLFKDKNLKYSYLAFTSGISGGDKAHASLCIDCGKCEKVCPQHLPIRKHLKEVVRDMEPKWTKPLFWGVDKYLSFKRRHAKRKDGK